MKDTGDFFFEDLLNACYKQGGRYEEGKKRQELDCYGFLQECYRRCGVFLPALLPCVCLAPQKSPACTKDIDIACLPFKKTDVAKKGSCIVYQTKEGLHCAFLASSSMSFSMTHSGPRFLPLSFIKEYEIYEPSMLQAHIHSKKIKKAILM